LKGQKMLQLNNKYLLGIIASIMIIGCGSIGDGNTSGTVSNDGSSASVPQCTQQLETMLFYINDTYTSNSDNEDRNKDSDDRYDDDDDEKDSDGDKDSDDDDNDEKTSSGGTHNVGRACAQCHSKDFDSGATVFTKLTANNGNIASGYKIQLGNSMVYSAGRGTGNSHLNHFNGGSFTAHVINGSGNIVNSSAENSHDRSRLDCNRCHTSGGAAGAPGRIVNYKITSTPSSTPVPANTNTSTCVSFSSNVVPILSAKCKSCHGSNGRFTVISANGTYANIGGLKSPITTAAQYVIDKGSNSIGHGGGSVISTSSPEYKTIKAWINEGALNN
jgi:cytochrome c553